MSYAKPVPTVALLGVEIARLTMTRLCEVVAEAVESGTKAGFAFCTVHTLIECQSDPRLRQAVNRAVACPDGMPIVWLSGLKGGKIIERVYGPDAMLALCERAATAGWRNYFYGSSRETLSALTARLVQRYPGLVVAGYYSPPFRPITPEEDEEIVARINETSPDLVWVGLGMPKQELWMAEHQSKLNAPVVLAVGAAFDFHAGMKRQAPRWMQRSGLEWLFRLSQEPRRLWKRYLVGNARFVYLVLRQLILTRRLG
jgi:N-acetylglucosaminyldiphosphoundecaprenol N-acetyl-beta-D-mannosaminyltransferase